MPTRHRLGGLSALCALSLSIAAGQGPGPAARVGQGHRDAGEPPGLLELLSPAKDGSAQPQLAGGARGQLLLSWLEPDGEGHRLRYATWAGSTWSPPITVVEGTDFFVNWADVPSVVELSTGRLVGHWLQKSGPGTYAYDVWLRYSDDRGKTWSRPAKPHRDDTRTEHGFVTLYEPEPGVAGLVWLDGRSTAGTGHDAHATSAGAMSLRATTLRTDGTLGDDLLVDDRVCDCCPTTAAVTASGPLIAYRNRDAAEVRDVFVSRHVAGRWTPPVPVHDDGWVMPACPVNGPALASRGADVALAWFTAQDNEPRVLVAFSRDAGRTFGPPVRVDDGIALGRVDVDWVAESAALVSWIEFKPDGSEFRVRQVGADGTLRSSRRVARVSTDRASGYPRLARAGGRTIVAWTEVAPVRRVRVAELAGPF
jgi:hypothetical protein